MKKALIVCLLAAALSMAQRQRVAVLPSIADPETKLSARELDVLTEKLRGYASDVLPLSDFVLLKQDYVKEKLGDEALFKACKEGTCVGDLIAMVQADFGARCDVFSVNGKMWLKFELYGTLKGEDDAGTISTFSEEVKDLKAMEVAIEKRVPDAFRKILPELSPAAAPPAAAPPPVQPVAPAAGGTRNESEAYFKKGIEYFDKTDYDWAISEFTKAIRLNPNYAEAYSNRGMAYGNKGDYDRAISDYTEAIQLDPRDVNSYYNRGNAYLYKKDYDRAISDWKSALLIDPNDIDAQEALQEQADNPKGVRFYISPKYQLPIGTPVPWGGLALGLGWIWSNGVFFGIDGNFGYITYDEYDKEYYRGNEWCSMIGGGLSLGYSHDLPNHFKLAYGGSLGIWYSGLERLGENVDYRSASFVASFVKLRWRYLEASYKLFLGYTETEEYGYYGEYKRDFGIAMHELAIGLYFGGW